MDEPVVTRAQLGAAIIEARNAERERIRAITSLPEAVGKEALALSIATTSSKSLEEAKTALSSGSASSGDANSLSASWDKVFERRGMTAR